LIALFHGVQIMRPAWGYRSDVGGRRTPWIIGGMGVLASGGIIVALATVWMGSRPVAGMVLALLGFVLIGLGVSASGTSLLVLLSKRVAPERRAGAATLVWLMMICGFAVTAGVAGRLLDPYSPMRLVAVVSAVSLFALALTGVALFGLEGDGAGADDAAPQPREAGDFRAALHEVWADAKVRRFAIFVFMSMLAYSAQDLILEPFAGTVMGYTPGQSTSLSGVQHGGVLAGMLLAAMAGRRWRGRSFGSLRGWTIGGCVASALAMAGLFASGLVGPAWPFKQTVFVLGVANGSFTIAAIGSMMQLASEGGGQREGVRMGLWGAAQAIAFGLGGLLGTGASDLARLLFVAPGAAYGSVFALEGVMFLVAARIAAGRLAPMVLTAPAQAGLLQANSGGR
jgi:BCD family chlorophyll transporter-like MFS transporter